MKMESSNPFSALNELKSDYFICLIQISNYAFRRVFRGWAQIIIIVGEALRNSSQYYMGGGLLGPQSCFT